MTTTFVRLKNRRGNKADLPKPLAEGELGFATDTRELYIGGGNQSSKNRMVQVDDYINSQVSTQSDLDNKIVTFLLTGTEHVKGDGVNARSTDLNGGSTLTFPTSGKTSTGNVADYQITKFSTTGMPTTMATNTYTISTGSPNTLRIDFTNNNVPEANSVVVFTKWTEAEVMSAVSTAIPSITANVADANNDVYVDYSTGTGFVNITDEHTYLALSAQPSSSSYSAINAGSTIRQQNSGAEGILKYTVVPGTSQNVFRLRDVTGTFTNNAADTLNVVVSGLGINYSTGVYPGTVFLNTKTNIASTLAGLPAIASAGVNTGSGTPANVYIRGTLANLSYPSEPNMLTVDGTLLLKTDSPKQADLLSNFLNRTVAQGPGKTTVANNIRIYTQDSKPEINNNIYYGPAALLKLTLNTSTTDAVVTSFDLTESNTMFVDYSFKYGTALAVGTIRVIATTSGAEFIDDRTETDPTSDITFSADVNSGKVRLRYSNASSSQNATLSYVVKRWRTE